MIEQPHMTKFLHELKMTPTEIEGVVRHEPWHIGNLVTDIYQHNIKQGYTPKAIGEWLEESCKF